MANPSMPRHDRLLRQRRDDVFQATAKPKEAVRCLTCGAAFRDGRWTWRPALPGARRSLCPACRRTVYGYPAGRLALGGPFFVDHREEILHLVRNIAALENARRPLERIMAIDEGGTETLVTTSGVHLARRIAQALFRSHRGRLTACYGEDDKSLRVRWER